MEDAHTFVYDYGGVHGQGFFGVFDGHAGKASAEWCGKYLYQVRCGPSHPRYPVAEHIANPPNSAPSVSARAPSLAYQ